jgi:hypothetical protein
MIMRKYLTYLIITWFTLAFLILPSSALEVCDCPGQNPGQDIFLAVDEALICYEYCKSPVAYDSNVTVCRNTLVEIPLNATDPDGDLLTYRIDAGPLNGILALVGGNKVVYIARENFTGTDSFSFTASDGNHDSNIATVTITVNESDGSSRCSHLFYGNVTIDGNPAPKNTTILATGPGARSDMAGNPVTTLTDGSYGSGEITGQKLMVQGCIEDGTPLSFYVDGVPAEVRNADAGGLWQPAFPFRAGGMTRLDIRVLSPSPLPKEVYIDAISIAITNSTYGFSSLLKLEKDPWLEARVTKGMFTVRISATGFHRFSDMPEVRRDATLGIYEHGIPLSSEKNVWFGSRVVTFEYVPVETRTLEVLIYVNENPGIYDIKHITIHVASETDVVTISAVTDPGNTLLPIEAVQVPRF